MSHNALLSIQKRKSQEIAIAKLAFRLLMMICVGCAFFLYFTRLNYNSQTLVPLPATPLLSLVSNIFIFMALVFGGINIRLGSFQTSRRNWGNFSDIGSTIATAGILLFNLLGDDYRHSRLEQQASAAPEKLLAIESVIQAFRPGQSLQERVSELESLGFKHTENFIYQSVFNRGNEYNPEIRLPEYMEEGLTVQLIPDASKTKLIGWKHISYFIKERPLLEDRIIFPASDVCKVIQEYPSQGKYPRQCSEAEAAMALIRPWRCKSECNPCDNKPKTIEACA